MGTRTQGLCCLPGEPDGQAGYRGRGSRQGLEEEQGCASHGDQAAQVPVLSHSLAV